MITSLNYLKEEGWSVLCRHRKDLKQVAFFVVVNQNFELLNRIYIFLDFNAGFSETRA